MSKDKTKYTNWSEINWRKLEKKLWKLQKRIFRAKREGNVKLVKQLQKLLVKSFAAKTIAVRKVTQDNRGKRTAGIDGIKSILPNQRLKLVNELKISHKAKPLRRIYIPKANSDEKRPLSIPTINDRAVQMLVKMALEPEWEAIFEPNSYGFRLGRQSHDAIQQIFGSIKGKPKWVLDADISKCFDSINHSYLLNKLGKCPKNIRVQIKAWLKAGYLEGKELFPTKEGTPQGGTVSPLLANIALHGMENVLTEWVKTWKGRKDRNLESFSFIRYADDFVCLHESKEVIEKAKDILSDFLKPIGLQLKPEKTQIVHTLQTNKGFDFLGFNIRQYQIQNGKTSKHTGVKRAYKTLIKPSKKAIKRHYEKMANTVRNNRTVKQENLIKILNPIIKGWCNYHSSAVSSEVFSKLDHLVYGVLRRWCNRRHPKKSKHWIKDRYYHQVVTKDSVRNWVFKEGNQTLLVHADTKIERHIKVKGEKSPYDGDTVYWASRLGRSKELDTSTGKLLKHQKGKCSHCGATFIEGDIMEIDHILPKSLGGKNSYNNLQLIHAHCHDQKTSDDGSLKRGIHDKNQVREERYEAKASRTVLQTSSHREIVT
jgi:RNA-directed DNA polymerase